MTDQNLNDLRENLASLLVWMESRSYRSFVTAREEEIRQLNESISYHATCWDDIVSLRAERDSIVSILSSFGETRTALDEAIDEIVEKTTLGAVIQNEIS